MKRNLFLASSLLLMGYASNVGYPQASFDLQTSPEIRYATFEEAVPSISEIEPQIPFLEEIIVEDSVFPEAPIPSVAVQGPIQKNPIIPDSVYQVHIPVVLHNDIHDKFRGYIQSKTCNNKFGAHILLSDVDFVNEINQYLDLVLEMTGECGWVKGFDPYMDKGSAVKWGIFVSEAQKRNLIPFLRLGYGANPKISDAAKYGDYVNWVINDASSRFSEAKLYGVEIWNEPNIESEWSSVFAPEEYAAFLKAVSVSIRNKNPGVKIINGALAMTNGGGKNIATEIYIDRMFGGVPELPHYIDIWGSHPYPQDFMNCGVDGNDGGNPKFCFNAYKFELSILRKHFEKMGKQLPPVMITETSWRSHYLTPSVSPKIAKAKINGNYAPEEFAEAFASYWANDRSVIGVTPFQFSTKNKPWDTYSFIDPVTHEPNEYFFAIKSLREKKR